MHCDVVNLAMQVEGSVEQCLFIFATFFCIDRTQDVCGTRLLRNGPGENTGAKKEKDVRMHWTRETS